MSKLLVNQPNRKQSIISVNEGGGYFDSTLVLWDERIDGSLPAIVLGGMERVGNRLTFNQVRMDEHTEASKPPIPQAVTMRQARLALLSAGKLSSVNSAIAGMTGPAGDAARIEWEFSIEVKRQQPLVLSLGKALGMSSLQLDDLFVAAAAL